MSKERIITALRQRYIGFGDSLFVWLGCKPVSRWHTTDSLIVQASIPCTSVMLVYCRSVWTIKHLLTKTLRVVGIASSTFTDTGRDTAVGTHLLAGSCFKLVVVLVMLVRMGGHRERKRRRNERKEEEKGDEIWICPEHGSDNFKKKNKSN